MTKWSISCHCHGSSWQNGCGGMVACSPTRLGVWFASLSRDALRGRKSGEIGCFQEVSAGLGFILVRLASLAPQGLHHFGP